MAFNIPQKTIIGIGEALPNTTLWISMRNKYALFSYVHNGSSSENRPNFVSEEMFVCPNLSIKIAFSALTCQ